MTTTTVDSLFGLLPAVYRLRDADDPTQPLRALLSLFAEQIGLLEEDLAQLYDDQFVETCADWVIPYIGDLAGTSPLFDASRIRQLQTARSLFADLAGPGFIPNVALRSRTDVARTISFRRRKATRPMLEELSEAVTGWGAHVVEFFELLKWTQCVRNHLRTFSHATPDLHRVEPLGRISRAFDEASHMVDVRPISQLTGWDGIRNVGFFLWRLRPYELLEADAANTQSNGYGFLFNPVSRIDPALPNALGGAGTDTPLFSRLRRTEGSILREEEAPQAIRPELFCEDVRRHMADPPISRFTDFYSEDPSDPNLKRSFTIKADGVVVARSRIRAADLSTWSQPPDDLVAVDVRAGRIAFSSGHVPLRVVVSWHYGFPADLGGGPYPRSSWLVKQTASIFHVTKATGAAIQKWVDAGQSVTATIGDAIQAWRDAGRPDAVIIIHDNRTYKEPGMVLDPLAGHSITIEAADHTRPHLKLTTPIVVGNTAAVGDAQADENSAVTLSGLLIQGTIQVDVPRGTLRLLHSTLVPLHAAEGLEPSLVVDRSPGSDLRVEIAFSITGPLRIPDTARGLWLLDSIVDGEGGEAIGGVSALDTGPKTWVERTTIFGSSQLNELTLATETIFNGLVTVKRRQEGCVRFSYVPDGSTTPRRYRCQPDLEIDAGTPRDIAVLKVKPFFTSMRYGDAAYAQLHLNAPLQISRGAEDGSEMGAYCHLKQPQREANLRIRLREYLPFGLEAGVIYVT